jgi:hypothetical protein
VDEVAAEAVDGVHRIHGIWRVEERTLGVEAVQEQGQILGELVLGLLILGDNLDLTHGDHKEEEVVDGCPVSGKMCLV